MKRMIGIFVSVMLIPGMLFAASIYDVGYDTGKIIAGIELFETAKQTYDEVKKESVAVGTYAVIKTREAINSLVENFPKYKHLYSSSDYTIIYSFLLKNRHVNASGIGELDKITEVLNLNDESKYEALATGILIGSLIGIDNYVSKDAELAKLCFQVCDPGQNKNRVSKIYLSLALYEMLEDEKELKTAVDTAKKIHGSYSSSVL